MGQVLLPTKRRWKNEGNMHTCHKHFRLSLWPSKPWDNYWLKQTALNMKLGSIWGQQWESSRPPRSCCRDWALWSRAAIQPMCIREWRLQTVSKKIIILALWIRNREVWHCWKMTRPKWLPLYSRSFMIAPIFPLKISFLAFTSLKLKSIINGWDVFF